MKNLLVVATIAFAITLCNLTERLAGREQGNSQSGNQNSNQSNTSSIEPAPPPSTGANQNSAGATTTASANTVSGGVLNEKATSLPKPAYPPVAKAAGASGTVVVEVIVDETGKVTSATAVSGHPLLRQSAVQAAYQARFAPTKLSGTPVKVSGTITYDFQL
jgi:periplasmic protein TonB